MAMGVGWEGDHRTWHQECLPRGGYPPLTEDDVRRIVREEVAKWAAVMPEKPGQVLVCNICGHIGAHGGLQCPNLTAR